jgi:hypothetical protein
MTMVEAFHRERVKAEAAARAPSVLKVYLRDATLLGSLGLMWVGAFVFRGSHLIT